MRRGYRGSDGEVSDTMSVQASRRLIVAALTAGGAALAAILRPLGVSRTVPASEALAEGLELHRQGRYRQAIRVFTSLIASGDAPLEAYLFRGIAAHNAGLFADAVRDFTQVLEADPEQVQALFYRGESHLAMDIRIGRQRTSPPSHRSRPPIPGPSWPPRSGSERSGGRGPGLPSRMGAVASSHALSGIACSALPASLH